jgi:hypothetical protein
VGYAANRKTSSTEPQAKEPVDETIKFAGLDVHAETIAVAVAEQDGEMRKLPRLGTQTGRERQKSHMQAESDSCLTPALVRKFIGAPICFNLRGYD